MKSPGALGSATDGWTGRGIWPRTAQKNGGRGLSVMGLFSDLFTWWNGATLSTRLYTNARGKLVGQDDQGNRYYEDRNGKGPAGRPRRWVIYKGYAEASKVPPDWYGWLHYMVDIPPTGEAYHARPWQKPHLENMTGTPQAYHPPGSLFGTMRRPRADGDYQPWSAE